MDRLAALRALVRIVGTGSFTQAVATLGTPKPTVRLHMFVDWIAGVFAARDVGPPVSTRSV